LQYYLAIWSLLLGLVIGSFLNVVIYRLPRRESLLWPGSHCPGCGSAISWRDNIPVVSWLILRAKCRSCRSPISVRYPLVEGITGVAFLAAFVFIGVSPAVLLAWALIAVVVALVWMQHDNGVIPDRLVIPAVLCGLGASVALDTKHWWYYLVGSAGAGAVALLLSFLTPGPTTFGQAKIAMLLGAVFGPYALAAVPIALVLRTFAGITLVFWQKGRLRARTVVTPYHTQRDVR
jgi:leader peptidase (prepilin peptidase)/N-methyltransferase